MFFSTIKEPEYYDELSYKLRKKLTKYRKKYYGKNTEKFRELEERYNAALAHVAKMRRAAGIHEKLKRKMKDLSGDYSDKAAAQRAKIRRQLKSLKTWHEREKKKYKQNK